MTFTQIRQAVLDYCNLTSPEATTRVGNAINRHYRRITSSLGLEATRFITRVQTTTLSGQTVMFAEIEKLDRVLDVSDVTARRLLAEVSLHDLGSWQPGSGPPMRWALQHTAADAVTILLDTQPGTVRTLQADGWSTLADLSGIDEPVFPESFRDVLVWYVIAEELLKKEKLQLAGTYEAKAEALLADLRFHLADSHTRQTRQAGPRVLAASGGGGVTLHHATHETGGTDALEHLSASILDSGTLADARLSSNVVLENLVNVFTESQRISKAIPALAYIDTSQPADQGTFQILNFTQRLEVRAWNDAFTVVAATPIALARTGDAFIGRDLYEKARTTPLGHWIDVPFNAADYTANAGLWTVEAGDFSGYAYTLIGKTCTIQISLNTTTVITSTPTTLFVQAPPGITPVRTSLGAALFNNGGWQAGYVIATVPSPGGLLSIKKATLAAFTAVGDFGGWFSVTFPIL